ncbi:alpha/beta hydrolase [Microbacterium sp. M3]|uniref:Alpha/beta hydrolase n=1 Tax=Microbacterium arthrosphaerae TaxID=792652 RepID=A0ABU4H4C6_9MICO|nr:MULTISPECIES: alpha/beta hydrolase [Microbacterium]MDW4574182.1 alpha/beta hydrolase [Microbacterium arthrosphaerae]MDW7608037.1 alpha/beta hydrolase [Microbacterium sp. M3]
MRLDPFFEERLRVHRKYMFDQAVGAVRSRLTALWPFGRPSPLPAAAPAAPAQAKAQSKAREKTSALGPHARARARHRRAALAWDRTELSTVGTSGPEVRITEHQVPVPGHPAVRVRIYHPSVAGHAPVPAVLAFYGGAFRIGGIDYPTTDAAYRRRCVDAHVAIAAVDYALAPEHRYPVQVEQAHAALEWLFESAGDVGVDPSRIGVLGISAGGNLAAALTIMNRDRGDRPLALQVLEVPVVDLTGDHMDLGAMRALRIPRFLTVRELRSVARTYLARPQDARESYASPLRAASHRGLPPAVILTAEYDPLRGDGDAYGAALRRAGVDASVVRYQGVTHDTPIFTGVLPAARRWHDDVVAALRRLHA